MKASAISSPFAGLKTAWQRLNDIMNSSSELTIWRTSSRMGHIYFTNWYIYDPKSGNSTCFRSEEDLRVWLDDAITIDDLRRIRSNTISRLRNS